MSLSPTPINDVPELTARAAFPTGNRYMQMRDTLGTIYADVQFADLYPTVGQPAEAPWRLALVTIMQFAENLGFQEHLPENVRLEEKNGWRTIPSAVKTEV